MAIHIKQLTLTVETPGLRRRPRSKPRRSAPPRVVLPPSAPLPGAPGASAPQVQILKKRRWEAEDGPIAAARLGLGKGKALSRNLKRIMSAFFGVDFADVRLHDSPSDQKAVKQAGAEALTFGRGIFLSKPFREDDMGQLGTLAHEFKHQQQAGQGRITESLTRQQLRGLEGEAENAERDFKGQMSSLGSVLIATTSLDIEASEADQHRFKRIFAQAQRLAEKDLSESPEGRMGRHHLGRVTVDLKASPLEKDLDVARRWARAIVSSVSTALISKTSASGPGSARPMAKASLLGRLLGFGKEPAVAELRLKVDTDSADRSFILPSELQNAAVGHTWIGLDYKDGTSVPSSLPDPTRSALEKGERTFGFWPLIYRGRRGNRLEYLRALEAATADGSTPGAGSSRDPAHTGFSKNPLAWVPGRVEEPDNAHEGSVKAEKVWDLNQDQVDDLLKYVESKRDSKYNLYRYNCTSFGVEAVKAAGEKPPSGDYLFSGIALPNALYRSMYNQRGDSNVKIKDLADKEEKTHGDLLEYMGNLVTDVREIIRENRKP